MAKKNKLLLGLFLVALVINMGLLLLPKKGTSVAFEERMFLVSDTSVVTSIELKSRK